MFAVLVEVCVLLVCYMVRQEMVQNVTLQPHDYKDSYCKSRAKYQEAKKKDRSMIPHPMTSCNISKITTATAKKNKTPGHS